MIVNQCGTSVINVINFKKAWLQPCDKETFRLNAIINDEEINLGTFQNKDNAIKELDRLIEALNFNILIDKSRYTHTEIQRIKQERNSL